MNGKAKKQTYYCVTTACQNIKCRVSAKITAMVEAEERPAATCKITARKDTYDDWYASLAQAKRAVAECCGA